MSRRVVSHPRSDSEGLIVEVPLTFRKRGGRKQMITPDGSRGPAGAPTVEVAGFGNVTLVRALARAHRWREMLENGCFNSITELAEAEGVNRSYLCRMLRLTLLSPEITTEVLDGRGAGFRLDGLMQPFCTEWNEQQQALD
jgi:hypothetical protein